MQLHVLVYLYLILSKICGSFTVVYNEFQADTKLQWNPLGFRALLQLLQTPSKTKCSELNPRMCLAACTI